MKSISVPPVLQDVATIEDEYLRWSRRIKPPTEFRKSFNAVVSDLFLTLSSETCNSLNNLRFLPDNYKLPEQSAIVFKELHELFLSDWFESAEEDDDEYHVPD